MGLTGNTVACLDACVGMSVLDFQASTDFAADWGAWHKQHEARLAAPDGFLAITSINWLTETPTRFPDAPGEWAADDSGITVAAGPRARRGRSGHPGLQPGDQPAVPVHRLRDQPAPAGREPPPGGRRGRRADPL